MNIHNLVKENIYVLIVYKLLEQKKNWNIILKTDLILMLSKRLKYQKKMKALDSKIIKEK